MQLWLYSWWTVTSHGLTKNYKQNTSQTLEAEYWLTFGAYLSAGEDLEFRAFLTWAYKASTVCPSLGLCGLLFIVPLFVEELYNAIPAYIESPSHPNVLFKSWISA